MELKRVVIYDNYMVTSASMLSGYDRKILTLLYQPLCGYGALSLYLTLWCKHESCKERQFFNHKNLFSSMDCSVEEFEKFRDKLEGLGLIKTLVKENDESVYCYELYSPLGPKEFFKHELLGTLLKQKLDDDEYKELKSFFVINKENNRGFCDVSHNFNEVYNLDLNDTTTLKRIIEDDDEMVQRKNGRIGSNFSLEIFLMVLKENKIRKSLITNSFVELMESMANLYRLDEYEMCNILLTSIEGLGSQERINYETFKRKCFEYRKVVKVSVKDVRALENKKQGISKKAEMLQELEPFQFLRIKQGNMEPSAQDVKLVEDLSLMSKLNPGVINVLLDYVMINKQNTLPYNYVMKIAASLARENIETAIEAMEYFTNYKTKYTRLKKEEEKIETVIKTEPSTRIAKEEKTKIISNDDDLEYEMLKKAIKEKKNNAAIEV